MPKYENERYNVKNLEFKPMLAKMLRQSDKNYNEIMNSSDWIVEEKFDGVRAIITVKENNVLIQNRYGLVLSDKFPELVLDLSILPDGVFDAEIVVRTDGKDDFHKCQMRCANFKEELVEVYARDFPATVFIFDCMRLGSKVLVNESLEDRKAVLSNISSRGRVVIVYFSFLKFDEFVRAEAENREGVMIKRFDSLYCEKRSDSWLKLKCFKVVEAFVIGYELGDSGKNWHDLIGHLILADVEDGKWVYKGGVGGGFSLKERIGLKKFMDYQESVERPVFVPKGFEQKATKWVKPVLRVKVQILELSKFNRFRFPEFRGVVDNELVSGFYDSISEIDYQSFKDRLKRC